MTPPFSWLERLPVTQVLRLTSLRV